MKPEKITIPAGTHAWCVCGKSDKQPYCNGAHKETDKVPTVEKLEKPTDMFFCRCGKSANTPFCDGSHSISE